MSSAPLPIADALHDLDKSDALRDLEARLKAQNTWNLFDAIGVANQELRHSDFLRFLLNPTEAHGLGDAFLKWFLCAALSASPSPPVSLNACASWDLLDAHIVREWQNVDLFITSPQNNLAVVVENKIHTGEHSDQLTRYRETAENHGHTAQNGKTLLGVYLTPHGGTPSHPNYLPIGYEAVCARLEALCETGAFSDAESPDVETTVRHYTRMLRRKIVGDPEITKLCRDLYQEHQAAFERVFAEQENKIEQKIVTSRVNGVVGDAPGIVSFHKGRLKGVNYSQFVPIAWANEKGLLTTDPKVRNPRCFYLQVETYANGLVEVSGIFGPCKPQIRQSLVALVTKSGWLNFVHHPGADGEYRCFYRFPLRDATNKGEILKGNLLELWQNWVETEGPKFANLIQPGDFPAA